MDNETFALTRRSLHGLAELVLGGPQFAASDDIRLRVTPGGFGTVAQPDVRVDGTDLVVAGARTPLSGTYEEVAAAAGLEARDLADVYGDGAAVRPDEPVTVDADAARTIAEAFSRGDAALRALSADEEPILWPEHFDIGISLDEVNYGVSPGDAHIPVPYAYVGPWTRREGPFWNMPFGATRPMAELPDVDAVETFFREGSRRASEDPVASD